MVNPSLFFSRINHSWKVIETYSIGDWTCIPVLEFGIAGWKKSLKLTANFAPENRQNPKRKGSYSNHPFSGAKMLVSGRVLLTSILIKLYYFTTPGKPSKNKEDSPDPTPPFTRSVVTFKCNSLYTLR